MIPEEKQVTSGNQAINWQDFYEHDAVRPFEERELAHSRLDSVAKALVKHIITKKRSKVCYLDIGFTDGYLLQKMSKNEHYEVYGIDIAHQAVERLRQSFQKSNTKVSLLQGATTQIPFESNSFNAVSACEILEHLEGATLTIALQEIHRVLVRGGILVATTPYKENVESNYCKCPHCGKIFNSCGHFQSFDNMRWKSLLLENNFKPLAIESIYGSDFRLNKMQWALPFIQIAARFFQINSLTKFLIVARKV